MKKLENKIYEYVNSILTKIIKPDMEINKVTQLDKKMILEIKERYGIEGIILDVDETLRKNMKKIPKCNEKWLQELKEQIKVIVVSNGVDKNIEEFLKQNDIEYISFALKPLKKNFIKACENINVQPNKVLVIGDSIISDIYGGKNNNMKTALVREVEEER